ncbi:hypothetical protein ABH924_003308 [Arthrobacter sp. GAS37]|uniref:hypothetical protein n=1 Tax=Arthrobacter sp. GAS37 TaxID=3156261 RepID=UPI003832B784
MEDLDTADFNEDTSELCDSATVFCAQRRFDALTVALSDEPFSEARRGELAAFLSGDFRAGQQAWQRLEDHGSPR